MAQIQLSVSHTKLTLLTATTLVGTSVNYDTCKFNFGSEWDGYTKTAVFYSNMANEPISMLIDTEGICTIPWESLQQPGLLYIGIFGIKDNVEIPTNFVTIRISQGSAGNNAPPPPTLDIYTQILKKVSEAKSLEESYAISENLRNENEVSRIASENIRVLAEDSRIEAENTRQIVFSEINNKITAMQSQLNDISFYSPVSAISNAYTLDLNKADNFSFETTDTTAKTLAFANVPTTANLILTVTAKLKYTNVSAISYPASVKWQNGTIPTFTAGKEYLLMFVSYDNGTSWLGYSVGAW